MIRVNYIPTPQKIIYLKNGGLIFEVTDDGLAVETDIEIKIFFLEFATLLKSILNNFELKKFSKYFEGKH